MREQKREYRIAHYLKFSLIKNKLKQLTKMPTPTPYKGQKCQRSLELGCKDIFIDN
jgi:hypothetical protein